MTKGSMRGTEVLRLGVEPGDSDMKIRKPPTCNGFEGGIPDGSSKRLAVSYPVRYTNW